jgi:phosphoserine phosphatase RsbU/P
MARERANTGRRLGGATPSLALLLDWLEDEYQNTVMRGALDAAHDRGVQLICFSGGVLDSPVRDGLRRNKVFELATPQSVGGVIALGGTLGNHSGPERLAEYCKRFAPLPQCCIGIRLAEMPSVLVDNEVGMREAIVHLIQVHGRKRLFFIRGPRMNEEAESRFAVYKRTLAEHGIPFEDALNHVGDFQPEAGYQAVCSALDAGVQFDAVVAANDSMAMGALRALAERGRNVPADVAVTGFDDVEEARYLDPPLTTVRQPLYEQGKEAVRLVVALMQGDKRAKDVLLRTELVTRSSCGCVGADVGGMRVDTGSAFSFEAQLIQRRTVVMADLLRTSRATLGGLRAGWEGRLLNALVDELNAAPPGAFIANYSELLQQASQTENPFEAWHDVLSTLRRHCLAMLTHDVERSRRAEDAFQAGRRLVSSHIERAQASKRIDAERLTRRMARVGAALLATFDEAALFEACREQIPTLGVTAVYLVRYRDDPPGHAELVFGHDAKNPELVVEPQEQVFPQGRLLPLTVKEEGSRDALVVEPLFFRDYSIGYAVFGFGPRNGSLYESLRDQISAALYGARLKRQ